MPSVTTTAIFDPREVAQDPPVQTLFPYQAEALPRILASKRLIIADVPGLGKTPMVCAALSMKREPALVICPAGVMGVWRAMLNVWAPEMVKQVRIISYTSFGLLSKESQQDLMRGVGVLVLDEAHYLSNTTAKRTIDILGPQGVARSAPVVWAITGTPMQRHAGQLYPLLRGLWPDQIKVREKQWQKAFCKTQLRQIRPGKYTEQIVGSKNVELLEGRLKPFMLRRTYEEVGHQLPDTIRIYNPIELPQHIRWEFGEPTSPTRLIGESKMSTAVHTISCDMAEGSFERPFILAYHHSVLDYADRQLRMAHPNARFFRIDGTTPPLIRDRMVADFQIARGPAIFIAQIQAVETGITLTNADRVEIIESTWNSAKDDQAIARVIRTGQKSKVLTRIHFVPDSIDAKMIHRQMVQRQDRLAAGL